MLKNSVLFLSLLTTALMAGLFYSWSISVMRGLKTLPDREFILSMQAMNRAIQNPLFFICFFGAAFFLLISCYQQFSAPLKLEYYLLALSTLIYLIGVLGLTIFGNVPLNNMLDSFNVSGSTGDVISKMRLGFEAKWNYLNDIRSISAIISTCLLILMFFIKSSDHKSLNIP
jgi:uncharacterized membrane protein